MRLPQQTTSADEGFCDWLASCGYRRPDGKLTPHHVSALLRGNLSPLVPFLLGCVKPTKQVQAACTAIQDYEERYTREAQQRHSNQEHALQVRMSHLQAKLTALESTWQQNTVLAAKQITGVVSSTVKEESLDMDLLDETLQAMAMKVHTSRGHQLLKQLQECLQVLRSLLQLASLQILCAPEVTPVGKGASVQDGIIQQLWERSRQQLGARLQHISPAYAGTFVDAGQQQLGCTPVLELEPLQDARQHLQRLLSSNPQDVLQVLAGIIRVLLQQLNDAEATAPAPADATCQVVLPCNTVHEDAAMQQQLDAALETMHKENWQVLLEVQEAERRAHAAGEALQGLQDLQASEAGALRRKVARLQARKAVLCAEVAARQQQLEKLRAAGAESTVLRRHVDQAAGWRREMVQVQRGLCDLLQCCDQSYLEARAHEQAFIAAAGDLCRQVQAALQYATNAADLEHRCVHQLASSLLVPSASTGPPLHDLQVPRLAQAARSSHERAGKATCKDSVDQEVVRAAAWVHPLSPLMPPAALMGNLLDLRCDQLSLAKHLSSSNSATSKAQAHLQHAEEERLDAEEQCALFQHRQHSNLLPALKVGVDLAQQTQQLLQGQVQQVLDDMLHQPAIHAAPWHTYEGRNASEWLIELENALQAAS